MTIETVRAFKTSDGQIFEAEQTAKDHEFEIALAAYWKNIESDFGADAEPAPHLLADILRHLIDDRMDLLPIFKLLNGGPLIVPLPPAKKAESAE